MAANNSTPTTVERAEVRAWNREVASNLRSYGYEPTGEVWAYVIRIRAEFGTDAPAYTTSWLARRLVEGVVYERGAYRILLKMSMRAQARKVRVAA